MFSLFKKKNPIDKMYKRYEALMAESHKLSTSNRSASDAKAKEADDLLKEIEVLEKAEK
ncbi:MAG: Lacal_2735 family protein [Crocinitomicaceae bacterium]|nr:Lacal_2735 family protein [Crocinitomicaceae bacterium]